MYWIVFIVSWVLTFPIAWLLLGKLIARTISRKRRISISYIILFVSYRLVIALPYMLLLIIGRSQLSIIIRSFIIGIISLGLLLSLLRFFDPKILKKYLWQLYATFYDGLRYFYPYKKLQTLIAQRVISAPNNGSVLDLGCGTGNLLLSLRSSVWRGQYIGVDGSTIMLRKARKKAQGIEDAEFVSSDMQQFLSASNRKFDVVVMSNSLYTFTDRDELWLLLKKILKSNGRVIVTNSDRVGSISIIKEHIKNDSIAKLLHPKLIIVSIIDMFISELSKVGEFDFVDLKTLEQELRNIGGSIEQPTRCYGDVNILFNVKFKMDSGE